MHERDKRPRMHVRGSKDQQYEEREMNLHQYKCESEKALLMQLRERGAIINMQKRERRDCEHATDRGTFDARESKNQIGDFHTYPNIQQSNTDVV